MTQERDYSRSVDAATARALTMPNNAGAEAIVLGSVLFDAHVFAGISLRADEFYADANQVIWRAMQALNAAGMATTPETLIEQASGINRAYLYDLLDCAAYGFEVADNVKIVRDCATRRALVLSAESLKSAAIGDGSRYVDPLNVLSEHDDAIQSVRSEIRADIPECDLAEAGLSGLGGREERMARKTASGIAPLDALIGGFEPGTVTILAARPSMGKTAIAVDVAVRVAMSGNGVGYFSLEMPKRSIGLRAASGQAYDHVSGRGPKYQDLERGLALAHHDEMARAALSQPFMRSVRIDDRGGLTVAQIEQTIRGWQASSRRGGPPAPDLIIIDHMGHVRPSRSRNKTDDVADVSKDILALAKRLDVAVLSLCQLNRNSVSEGRRPQLHDLRQSGEIEEDAHAVIFLHREEYYMIEEYRAAKTQAEGDKAQERLEAVSGKAELIVAKNRDGPRDTVTIGCDIACNAFWPLAGVSYFNRRQA